MMHVHISGVNFPLLRERIFTSSLKERFYIGRKDNFFIFMYIFKLVLNRSYYTANLPIPMKSRTGNAVSI